MRSEHELYYRRISHPQRGDRDLVAVAGQCKAGSCIGHLLQRPAVHWNQSLAVITIASQSTSFSHSSLPSLLFKTYNLTLSCSDIILLYLFAHLRMWPMCKGHKGQSGISHAGSGVESAMLAGCPMLQKVRGSSACGNVIRKGASHACSRGHIKH